MNRPQPLLMNSGGFHLPGPGTYALSRRPDDVGLDVLLQQARVSLGAGAVGWLPAGGGLISNLAVWENVLLATEWLAPASTVALEARLRRWLGSLEPDESGAAHFLAARPARISIEQRRLAGWLRQMLLRPKLLLLETAVLPPPEGALWTLARSELGGSVLLAIDGCPAGWQSLPDGSGAAHDPVA